MTQKQRIEMLLAHEGKSKGDLAQALGISKQNFADKMNRGTLDEDAIAAALGVKLVHYFECADGMRI